MWERGWDVLVVSQTWDLLTRVKPEYSCILLPLWTWNHVKIATGHALKQPMGKLYLDPRHSPKSRELWSHLCCLLSPVVVAPGMGQLHPAVSFQVCVSKAAGEEPDEQQLPEASNPWGLGRHPCILWRAVSCFMPWSLSWQHTLSWSSSPGLLFQGLLCLGGDVEAAQQCVSQGRISLQALGPRPQRVKVAGSWVNFHRMRHSPVATQHFWHPTAAPFSHLIIFFVRGANSRY